MRSPGNSLALTAWIGNSPSRTSRPALFNRALGDGQMADFKKAVIWLLAQRMGARRADVKELRDAVLRGWLDREETGQHLGGPNRGLTAVSLRICGLAN